MTGFQEHMKKIARKPHDQTRNSPRPPDNPAEGDIGFTPLEALAGLPPQLVIDLARLAGATLDELNITLQLAPFGDRAVMAAYGLINTASAPVRVTPFCQRVAAAAADAVVELVDARTVGNYLQQLTVESDLREQYIPIFTPHEQELSQQELHIGVVRTAERSSNDLRLLHVAFARAHTSEPPFGGGSMRILVDSKPAINQYSRVQVGFRRGENRTPIPQSISEVPPE